MLVKETLTQEKMHKNASYNEAVTQKSKKVFKIKISTLRNIKDTKVVIVMR